MKQKKKTNTLKNMMLALAGTMLSTTALADVGPGICDGERPQFEDQKYQSFGGDQVIVGTQWRADDLQGVLVAYDLTGQTGAPLNTDWPVLTYSHADWVRSQMGSLFGIALDDLGNVYTSHTAIYHADTIGAIGGAPGQIYIADSVTGAPTVFATLPNNSDPIIAASAGIGESYPGLGNLCFDVTKQMVYVTNFEDGRIYRIDASGVCLSTWDHATGIVNDCAPETGDGEGAAPLGERVWGVQSFNGRVYYSVWVEDAGVINPNDANQIWSVQYDAAGEFIAGTEQLEITIPALENEYSNPVADIAFSATGKMMLAERSMTSSPDNPRFTSNAHRSRALEYMCNDEGRWITSPNIFSVGSISSGRNSAGGCDYSYAAAPNDRVWITGDALHLSTPDNLYGIQGIPQAGGDITNSILIDMDADVIQPDKTGIGSVEISCPGEIQAGCATITNEDILCELDGSGNYTVTFDLTNNSGQDVQHLLVLPDAGLNIVPSGLITLPSLLLDGDTTQVTLTLNGGDPGDLLCFTLSLNTADFEECCAIEHCIVVPDCDCAQIHDEQVECLGDGTGCFIYTFDVDNLTTETIFYSYFVPISPAGVTIDTGFADPSRWDFPPMLSLGTETVSVIICGAMPGEEVCFQMTLHTEGLDECCSFEVCVTAPECDAAGECPGDCNGDGQLNFFDVSIFLSEFTNQESRADMNNDNQWNFFDISNFLAAFAAGCP